jgi:signal-transduction protein with cAMP-binding, CBS, and nucleotidyltransferase domain
MYFIAKGDCIVYIKEDSKLDPPVQKVLREGDHLGEISMIYKCQRSATIISRNYNTMAKLSEISFKELISEYPEYLKYLKKHLYQYKDERKRFLKSMISRIEYFRHLSKEALHDVMYSFRPRYYEKGDILLRTND